MKVFNCERCGKQYKKRGDVTSKYCSSACQHPAQIVACHVCGRKFRIKPSKLRKGRGKYCSRSCARIGSGRKQYLNKKWLASEYIKKPARAIAKDLKVSSSTIQKWVLRFGLKIKSRPLSDEHKRKISPVGRKHSETTKEKMRQSQLGEKGHNWKGGRRVRDRLKSWKSMKKTALIRDGYACQACGKTTGLIDVHHKTPFRCFKDWRHAHEEKNLITLCRQCHFIEEAKKTFKNCQIGANPAIWNYVNLYDCEIGDNVKIGAFTEIGPAKIGNNVTIGAGGFIPGNIFIEDGVWMGPSTKFCNDRFPPSSKEQWEKTVIRRGVRIGEAVTILPGVTIGEGALIGAGSVVTKSVPAGETWAGNPARQLIKATPKEYSVEQAYERV